MNLHRANGPITITVYNYFNKLSVKNIVNTKYSNTSEKNPPLFQEQYTFLNTSEKIVQLFSQ